MATPAPATVPAFAFAPAHAFAPAAPATTVGASAPSSAPAPSPSEEAAPYSRQASEIAWPGRDFKVAHFLPGSVYLWACGERGDGEEATPVSRAEVGAAWVVLSVRFARDDLTPS